MDTDYYGQTEAPKLPSIATLGATETSITCSQHVAKTRYPEANRKGCSSFEDAAQMVKRGEAEFVLVPGAYPEISNFLMDDDLKLVKAFKMKIPALVYGNMVNDPTAAVEVIYHHKAVTSLLKNLPEFTESGVRFIQSSSNEIAYEAMVRHGERAGCVSNKLVFDHYRRPVLVSLRTARSMSWNVFAASKACIAKQGERNEQ